MVREFDKKLMFDNISFLIDKSGKKIGELEAEAGVSTGYISRTSKEDNAKPGIDFVVNVAEALGISVDTLINVNMSGLTSTELYLISFFEKLKSDTTEDKIEWDKESLYELNGLENDLEENTFHPLFKVETYMEKDMDGYPYEVTRNVMMSNSYEIDTFIAGDCFNFRMKNGSKLYIMNIDTNTHNLNDLDSNIIEIWMYKPGFGKQFLCSNQNETSVTRLVDDLYKTVIEYSKRPKIKSGLRDVIDAYINNDDISDDIDFIPF